MKILRTFAVMVMTALAAAAGTALKRELKESDRVVTSETDTAALAAVAAVSNSWAAAQAADRASRASEDLRVEVTASNLFAAAQAARYAGDTNLASNLEGVRTNLLQHFTALVDAERVSRSNQVWSAADTLMSDSRSTNAVTRAIAEAAAASAASATGSVGQARTDLSAEVAARIALGTAVSNRVTVLSTNRVTRLQTDDGTQWIDGTGGVWRVTSYQGKVFLPVEMASVWPETGGTNDFPFSSGDWEGFVALYTLQDYYFPTHRVLHYLGGPSAFDDLYWTSSSAGGGTEILYPHGDAWEYGIGTLNATVTNRLPRFATTAELAAVALPTNAIPGWLLFDSGSNKWYQVTMSNLSFTVWEVQ